MRIPPDQTTHGLRNAFARDGDERALSEPQRSRLVELRAELETPEGVLAVAVRQAADAESIRERGAAYFHELGLEIGVKAFEHPMMNRYFTAAESSRRALWAVHQMLGKSDGGINAAEVLESIRSDKGQ